MLEVSFHRQLIDLIPTVKELQGRHCNCTQGKCKQTFYQLNEKPMLKDLFLFVEEEKQRSFRRVRNAKFLLAKCP